MLINEIFYDSDGGDTSLFTEIWGPAGADLDGFTLVGINGANGTEYRTVELSGTIPDDGYFVITTDDAAGDVLANQDAVGSVDWQNGPDTVQLRLGEDVVDALAYGNSPDNMGEGQAAQDVSPDLSLSRDAQHTDTDDNGSDFSGGDPTPGS